MRRATCCSCGAPVIWTITTRGARMPVDVTPSIAGNFRLHHGTDGTVLAYVEHDAPVGATRYVSHCATCPAAGKRRRRPRKADRV